MRPAPLPPTTLIAAMLLLAPSAASALERETLAVTRASAPIRVDGVLDEADWARATPAGDFRLIQVREGATPVESTWVKALVDDRQLYFALRCENRAAGAVRASLAPRDRITDQDHISVHLDTYRDFHRAYIFGVNPYGVQLDGILVGGEPDFNWDAVWDAEVVRDRDGWTAEMAIPLRSLRFPTTGADRWGFWVRRQINKADEVCAWPLWRESVPGDVMLQAADLTGLDGVRGGGAFEVQPYAASAWNETRVESAPGVMAPWQRESKAEAGLDVRMGLTATLAGNLTFNPDFSQIEADALQIDVNRRFPLSFPEKRPFFLEGAEIFTTPLRLVYTRRIANPDYGLKLVGNAGKLRLGGIVARDGGGGSLEGVGAASSEDAAGEGNFGIARATLDMGEHSSIGVLLAARTSDRPERRVLPAIYQTGFHADGGAGATASADANLRLAHSLFLTGQFATSAARFDSVALLSTGERKAHRISDVAYSGALRWDDGVRYARLFQNYLGPEFRTETGFLDRVDVRESGLQTHVTVRPENAWLRSWQPGVVASTLHDHAGNLQEWEVQPDIELNFQKQTGSYFAFSRGRERWLGRLYEGNGIEAWLWNSLWQPLSFEVGYETGDAIYYADTDSASFLGWNEYASIEATARPSTRLTSEINVKRSRFSRDHGRGEIFDVWLLGARTTWQFTRRLYARFYPQYDTGANHLDADGLLAYVVHPGSVVYLGTNHGLDRLTGRTRATGRTLFLKASWRFQR